MSLHTYEGIGVPAFTPAYSGDHYTDTNSGQAYLSVGTSSSMDWIPVGGGTVTATGGALTANAVVLGAGTTDTKVVAGIASDGTSVVALGVAGSSVGGVDLKNATSGTISIRPPTGALGTVTVTVPAATTTLAGLAVANVFTKAQTVTPTRNTSATGTVTPDFSVSNGFMYTLTGNLTIANGTSPTDGGVYTFKLKQGGSGSYTLTLGSKYKVAGGAPTLSTAVGALDILSFIYDGTDDVYVGSFGKGAA